MSGIRDLSVFFSCFSAFPATKGDFASFLSAGLSLWFVYSGYAKKESARAEIPAGKDSSGGRFSLHPAAVRPLRSVFHPDMDGVLFSSAITATRYSKHRDGQNPSWALSTA